MNATIATSKTTKARVNARGIAAVLTAEAKTAAKSARQRERRAELRLTMERLTAAAADTAALARRRRSFGSALLVLADSSSLNAKKAKAAAADAAQDAAFATAVQQGDPIPAIVAEPVVVEPVEPVVTPAEALGQLDAEQAAAALRALYAPADDVMPMPVATVLVPAPVVLPADVRTIVVTSDVLAAFGDVLSVAAIAADEPIAAVAYGGSWFTATAAADGLAVAHRLFGEAEFEMAFFGIEPRSYADTIERRYKGEAFYFGMRVDAGGVLGPMVLGPGVQVVLGAAPAVRVRKARVVLPAGEAADARRADAAKRYAERVTTFEVGARVKCYAAAKPTNGTVVSVQGDLTPTTHTATILLDTGKTTTRLARTVTRLK